MPVMSHLPSRRKAGRGFFFYPLLVFQMALLVIFSETSQNIFFAAHAALLSFCSGGYSFQNGGRWGAAARGEKVPWMTKSTYKGFKTFIGAQ